ncbi:MAG: class I tRNA ligase family protein, partial [Planctomycetia bacterium]
EVAGQFCKDADKEIIRLLKDAGALLKREVYRHPYPFCPRAENDPLIQYARKSWFIRTTQFKDEFLANNEAIRWKPEHIKAGRFGDFLRNNVDWALSRERFWGTPLPIWECEATGKQEAIGSYAELQAKPGAAGFDAWLDAKRAKPDLCDDLKVHKPYIDAVTYDSPFSAGARMRRVTEVIDCWFDSGCMPFAQWGFPHQNKDKFKTQFPADFISEAIDQTRGWFYSQVAINTLLREELAGSDVKFPVPFKTCIVLGHLLGEDGLKMSKRKKNYREPSFVFDQYGADALRWLFLSGQPPWNSARFQEAAIQDSLREFLIRLLNVYSFFVIYANQADGYDPKEYAALPLADRPALDRWIVGELNATVRFVTEKMDAFENFEAAGRITTLVDALSNWYLRRSRSRFWAEGRSPDKTAAFATLYECLTTLSKVIAPFTPFFAEQMYRNLVLSVDPTAPESVHLCDWPAFDPASIESTLQAEMELVRTVVSAGRSARTEAKLKVRQPLARVTVLLADHAKDDVVRANRELVAEELNVKAVAAATDAEKYVDFTVKPNLKTLGPRHGKSLGEISKSLAAADGLAIRTALARSGSYTLKISSGATIELGPDDVMVQLTAKKGYAAAEGTGCVVVLETQLTDELKSEGLARELVHAVQGLRKEMELDFAARIRLGVVGPAETTAAVAAFGDYIQGETLATTLTTTRTPDARLSRTVTIDDYTVEITVGDAAGGPSTGLA